MVGLFISQAGLAEELKRVINETDQALSEADSECARLADHLAHYSYLGRLHDDIYRAKRAIDESGTRREAGARYSDLIRQMVTISGWQVSAARVFAIDYLEALNLLKRGANKTANAHKLSDLIDRAAARKTVEQIDTLLPAAEIVRNAAAHGSSFLRERPGKKAVTEPDECPPGFVMLGGGGSMSFGFSLIYDVASASFEGKVHELPIIQQTVDDLSALKAQLFTALVVWPDFVGERTGPLTIT